MVPGDCHVASLLAMTYWGRLLKSPHHFWCGLTILLCGLEGILQADGTVEHQMLGGRVLGIGAEVADSHELIGRGSLSISQECLHLTAGEHFQRVGVQASQVVLVCCIGIGIVEQVGVLTDLGVHAVVCVNPMDGCALDLTAIGRITTLGSNFAFKAD